MQRGWTINSKCNLHVHVRVHLKMVIVHVNMEIVHVRLTSDAGRKSVSPGQVRPPSSSSNTNGSIVFLPRRSGTTSVERRAFLPARTARTEKASWHPLPPNSACWCPRHADAGLKYLATCFCNVVVWSIVRRDAPWALVCQREMRDVTVTIVA